MVEMSNISRTNTFQECILLIIKFIDEMMTDNSHHEFLTMIYDVFSMFTDVQNNTSLHIFVGSLLHPPCARHAHVPHVHLDVLHHRTLSSFFEAPSHSDSWIKYDSV